MPNASAPDLALPERANAPDLALPERASAPDLALPERANPPARPAGSRRIDVEALARVEGEGALHVSIVDGELDEVILRIYEPPRLFEGFLRGRHYTEPPDITARICGICPVAYQMSACHALEAACGVTVGGQLRALRRLLYCGEWIESHALHVYMLHAPDFLGFPSGLHLAQAHRAIVERGLRMKKVGNDLMTVLAGREIHPVNVRLGGFYRLPRERELRALREPLLRARDDALATVSWVAGFDFPDLETDRTFVALSHPHEYALNEGRLVSSRGLDVSVSAFEEHVKEEHVPHSTALHATVDGEPYLVGPLARYELNYEQLSPLAREAATAAGLGPSVRNPFRSIVVRAVELVYACDEAIRILDAYEPPERPSVDVPPRAGRGHACTEAPRGTLYHRYTINERGLVLDARIVPPTAQSQATIEQDVRGVVAANLDLPHEQLQHLCEQAVRNHDPCISCATHFLRLEVQRS
jgi:sulfhydrogenase subunit alpha